MPTKLLTAVNDREIIDGAIATYVDAGGLADRYTVSPTLSGDATIQDTDGGLIVLPAGFTFDTVQFTASGVRFTQGDNTVTFTGSANFSVVLAGNPLNDAAGTTLTAAEFAAEVGATIGGPAVAGGTVAADGSIGDGGNGPGPTPTGEVITLTTGNDVGPDFVGGSGNTTFNAPVVQNQTGSGQLANTFETGDVLNGGGGTNVLNATLISSGAIGIGGFEGPSISATTTNIQQVFLRGQNVNFTDFASNPTASSTVDAEMMSGVEQWWSNNSRANIVVEDIRTRPIDTTFGMRLTDPQVGFFNYFNPLFLDGDLTNESALSIVIQEITGGVVSNELDNISVVQVNFNYNGADISLQSAAIQAADTWADLAVALQAEVDAEGLDAVTVTHQGNGLFVFNDTSGGTFVIDPQTAIVFGAAPDIDVRNRAEVGVIIEEGPTQTTVVLDGAGNGSQGGTLDIGVMSGLRGVEVFDILVDRDSHLVRIESTNAREGNIFLEEVNIANLAGGAVGDLQVGVRTIVAGVSTTTDDRLAATNPNNTGFQNVRSIDATGFMGELKISATIGAVSNTGALTDDIFDRYLDEAEDVVTFEYLLGDGGSNLSLFVNDLVSSDLDFALNIEGGAQDDRINLENLTTKIRTTVDGGLGFNTIEVNQSTGTNPTNAFLGFTNFDKLVVAGLGSTQNIVAGNMTAIDGGEVVIASQAGTGPVEVNQLRTDTELSISGKNQTIGAGNGNNDQVFSTVGVNYSRGIPGVDRVEITLDNTARLDGVLDLAALNVSTTGTAGVSVLDLTSDGTRETSNLVRTSAFGGINTVNFLGTQDLAININAMPAGASIVNGSALTGDLLLAMNGTLLTGANNLITGTAGAADTFAVYSSNVASNVTATVTGFETVQLGLLANQYDFTVNAANGQFRGVYNAASTSGVELYFIQHANSVPVSIINLGTTENVLVSTNNNTVAAADITLAAASRSLDNTISIELANDGINYAGAWATLGQRDLTIIDYRTVNLDLDTGDAIFGLTLNDGVNDTYTRTLNITGGDEDHSSLAATLLPTASLNIGQLDTALTRVDISGYDGELVDAQWASQLGSNAVVVGNEFNFFFDLLNNADFGQALQLFSGQLGVDADYVAGDTVNLDISGSILGTLVGPANLNFVFPATVVDKATGLLEIRDQINGAAPSVIPAGTIAADPTSAFEIEYVASTAGGNLTVSIVVTNTTTGVVLGPDEAFVTEFDFDVGGKVVLDETDIISGFITTFDFNTDAEDFGVVWQIDDFNAFGVDGVSLSNVTILDLAGLGVSGLADIVVRDGADYAAFLTTLPDGDQPYTDYGNTPGADFVAGNTVITSNGDLDFTILLTGVDFLDLSNENFVFAV